MDRIIWNDEFSSGNKRVDEQHEMLVAKLNNLIDAYKAPDDAGDTEWLFIEFIRKCQQHFHEEESLLASQGNADMDTLTRYQLEFGNHVEDLHRLSLLARRTIPVSLILFLRHWVIDHLKKDEMKNLHSLMVDN